MIRINQVKIPIFEYSEEKLRQKCAKLLKARPENIRKLRIVRRSVDARKKNDILFSFIVDIKLSDSVTGPNADTERAYIKALRNKDIVFEENIPLTIAPPSFTKDCGRPVIAGAGPCGIFCALILAEAGLKPIVIERGERVEDRVNTVEEFFSSGIFNKDSNVQFGEGGAGTFSDGKLNTSVKGQGSYIRYVLDTFCKYGASKEILYDSKPHVGTDRLVDIVKNMREHIISLGGEFLFNTKLVGFELENSEEPSLRAVRLEPVNGRGNAYTIDAKHCVLAIGHSARDTFELLHNEYKLQMEKKPFAMGVRIQHPQRLINEALYGTDSLSRKTEILGNAPYKLTHRCKNGRSVYSFCMCPGGFVVNSSSEEGRLCVNGMSYSGRGSENANSAIVVNVTADDFPGESPLSGMYFQMELEEKAYRAGNGNIPIEAYGDFKAGEKEKARLEKSVAEAEVSAVVKGYVNAADIREIIPEFISEAMIEGVEAFSKIIEGFNRDDALLCAVESRTSSPVRILRDNNFEASIKGIYPAGEGAGYAGGITSAAVDGIKTAQKIMESLKA